MIFTVSISSHIDSRRARNASLRPHRTVSEIMPALDSSSHDRERFEREGEPGNPFYFGKSISAYIVQEVGEEITEQPVITTVGSAYPKKGYVIDSYRRIEVEV